MKHLVTLATLGALLLLPACDLGGNGTRSSCVTSYLGTFDGTQTGRLVGFLAHDGRLFVTFDIDDLETDYNGVMDVDEDDGSLTRRSGGGVLDLTGNIDFNSCRGSGDWRIGSNFSGTWKASPRENAI